MTAGAALFTLDGHLYSKKRLGQEVFLLTLYKLIAADGRVVTGTVHIRHLGGGNFNMAIDCRVLGIRMLRRSCLVCGRVPNIV